MGMLKEVGLGESGDSLNFVKGYLARFGYLGHAGMEEANLGDNISLALRKFQEFFALDATGVVDRPTIRALQLERCGLRDWNIGQPLTSCPWSKSVHTLTYRFGRPSNDLSAEKAFNGVRNAINRWNQILVLLQIDLQLKELSAEADLHVEIEWLDPDLDGLLEGAPVAHADLPPDCGVVTGPNLPKPVHFDDSEYWTRDQVSREFHIESVALHELGHILGLVHAPLAEPDSIMAPTLPPNFIHPGPTHLDVKRLELLYK
jgi:predicted Zn-dependent protease